jgi:D-alanyl-D-alanine-carboxypeptidase/D-alanyl-D-alanine-endopeptidase
MNPESQERGRMTFSDLVRFLLIAVFALVVGFIVYRILWWVAQIIWQIVQAIRDDREFARLKDTQDLKARIDRWAADYLARRANVRLVIGVLQGDRRLVQGYGGGGPPDASPAPGKLIYEIGSVTKVFTGILLAKLEIDGVLKLEDPLRNFLPAELSFPDAVGAITLRQLATHTAGLPRLPDNLDATIKDQANPYANYSASELFSFLRSGPLDRPPGTKSVYSNLGMGLLGHLLSLKTGKPYETLVKETICEPLGMYDTTVSLSPLQSARLVPGHTPKGQPTSGWGLNVLAGAGGLRSTVDDLLRFLQANLGDGVGALAEALGRAHKFHYVSAWHGSHGLGWCIERDTAKKLVIHWHNGGTGGYVSFVAFEKSRGLGVVLLSNYGDAMAGDDSLDRIGLRILWTASKVSLGQSLTSAPHLPKLA